jgi:hypothetical protein
MEEKDVPGHIPREVQTGLRSEVELHEKAAHKTRPRWCLAWPRESRAWQVVAGRQMVSELRVCVMRRSWLERRRVGGARTVVVAVVSTYVVVVTGLGDR